MSRSARYLVYLLAILCVVANGLAWAGHVDMPAAAAESAEVGNATHGHVHDGDAVDGCDHCCHAGAHLLAVPREVGAAYTAATMSGAGYMPAASLAVDPDPPYIPPVA